MSYVTTISIQEAERIAGQIRPLVRESLDRARSAGNLSDTTANKLIFFHADKYLSEKTRFNTLSKQLARMSIYAAIRPSLSGYFSAATDQGQLARFYALSEGAESATLIDQIKIFGEAFGENAKATLAPNIEGLNFAFRNAYWILPATVFAAVIINKKIK